MYGREIKKGDRIASNDAILYGAPLDENTLGTALEDQRPKQPGELEPRVRVRWDSGEVMDTSLMDVRFYAGGSAASHQTDEEAADIGRLD